MKLLYDKPKQQHKICIPPAGDWDVEKLTRPHSSVFILQNCVRIVQSPLTFSPSTLSSWDLIFAFSFATTHISFLYNKSKLINWVVCSSANSVPWVNKAKNEYCNLTSSIWTYRRRKEKTTNIKTFLFLSSTFAEKIVCVNFFCCFSASIFVLGLRSKLKSLIFSII